MSGPEKTRSRGPWSHIVSKATACIAGKMTEYCALECKTRSEKGFKMHRSLHNHIERTCGKDLHRNENKSKVKSLFIPTLQGNKYWLSGYFNSIYYLKILY